VVLQAVGRYARAIGRERPAHLCQRLAQPDLRCVKPGWALEDTVGQVGQVLFYARDAQIGIDFVIVWRDIFIRNRPVLAIAVAAVGFEVVIRKAKSKPAPYIGLSTQAPGAHPGVVRAGVGMVLFVHYDVLAVVGPAPALNVGVDVSVRTVL